MRVDFLLGMVVFCVFFFLREVFLKRRALMVQSFEKHRNFMMASFEGGCCCFKVIPCKDSEKKSPQVDVSYPRGSMGLVYLPTFTIKNQPHVGKYIIDTWILWVRNNFTIFIDFLVQIFGYPLNVTAFWPLRQSIDC